MKDARSAAAVWSPLKKKLFALGGQAASTTVTKKRKTDGGDPESEDNVIASKTAQKVPTPRSRKPKENCNNSAAGEPPRKKTSKAKASAHDADTSSENEEELEKQNDAAVQQILESVNGVFNDSQLEADNTLKAEARIPRSGTGEVKDEVLSETD